jgi:hypothetical protein
MLSLPPSDFDETRRGDPRNANLEWPPNLTELRFNHLFLRSEAWWSEVACHWPATLHHLVFRDCKYGRLMGLKGLSQATFSQITSLRVEVVDIGHGSHIGVDYWIEIFPQLRFLSIPGPAMEPPTLWHIGPEQSLSRLEQLELTQSGEETRNFTNSRLISQIAFWLPTLWQIRLHESYAEFDDVWADCQDAELVLKDRVRVQNQAAGQIIHDPEEAGVSFF